MTSAPTEQTTSPGQILKAAREELGYSVSYVADALHLRNAVVESIENEDFSSFNSEVFLKGYVRSYCRLVNLHEERMIELLDRLLSSSRQAEVELEEQAVQAIKARQNAKKAVIVALLVFVAAIVYSLFFSPSDTVTDIAPGQQTEPAQTKSAADDESDDSIETEEQNLQQEYAQDESLSLTDSAPVADEDAVSSEAPTIVIASTTENTESNETMPQIDGSEAERVEPIESEVSLSTSAQETSTTVSAEEINTQQSLPISEQTTSNAVSTADLVKGTFKAEFTDDCWFTLANGEGKKVYAALKRAGQIVEYEGALPFHIVLGNARVVSVQFNDDDVDLASFTRRNGRAEFDLGIRESTQGE